MSAPAWFECEALRNLRDYEGLDVEAADVAPEAIDLRIDL